MSAKLLGRKFLHHVDPLFFIHFGAPRPLIFTDFNWRDDFNKIAKGIYNISTLMLTMAIVQDLQKANVTEIVFQPNYTVDMLLAPDKRQSYNDLVLT